MLTWKVELIQEAQNDFNNLDSYFKLYADNKRIRIIYEKVDDIIKVIAIDKREDLEVYRIALKRILSIKQN